MGSLSRLDHDVERYLRTGGERTLPAACPRCRAPDACIWWGRYWRALRTGTRSVRLPIRRVRCRVCHHAPGLRPAFLIARRLYARPLIAAAQALHARGLSAEGVAVAVSTEFVIAANLVRAWLTTPVRAEGP